MQTRSELDLVSWPNPSSVWGRHRPVTVDDQDGPNRDDCPNDETRIEAGQTQSA
jgi:hypothetical protein